MTAAAFTASYADFRLIKTRGVVSISFEIPVEQAQLALDVLGGMPVAAAEVHCAIARLNPGADAKQTPEPSTKVVASPTSAERVPNKGFDSPDRGQSKTAWRDMRMPNQAGILCDSEAFQRFVAERNELPSTLAPQEAAASFVRRYCGVKSRSDIRPHTPSGDRWIRLVAEYRVWMHAPEYADA